MSLRLSERTNSDASPFLTRVTFCDVSSLFLTLTSPGRFSSLRSTHPNQPFADWHAGCSTTSITVGMQRNGIEDDVMNRCLTLEEYLQEFVDDNTDSVEEANLVVTNQQAQALGFFFIRGLAGFVEYVRLQRARIGEQDVSEESSQCREREEFIN